MLRLWKDLHSYVTAEDKRTLPRSFMNLWLGNSAAVLVRHPGFAAALQRARENKDGEQRAREKAAEEHDRELKRREAERKAPRFLDFWHYRGIVYSAQKYQRAAGDRTYTVTEFFLQIPNSADQEIKLTGYDVPIANGQEVAVVYGSPKERNSGHAVAYCNLNIRKQLFLTENVKSLDKQSRRAGDWGISTEGELKEYIAKSGLA